MDELLRGNQYPFPSENDKVTTQFHWWKRRELSIGRKGVRPFCHEDHSATLQTSGWEKPGEGNKKEGEDLRAADS